jgi:uncharacterized protein (TIGR02996 family)
MRTFTFSDAKSHKFWAIDVQGTGFTVTYGKIGTAGQSSAKSFATAEKCQAEADKLVREKTGKGYVETTPQATASDDDAFAKALVANPDDTAAWSAYADYLTEQGDPRGEFMAVQLALEDATLDKKQRAALAKQEKALLEKHERDWLGPLAAFTIDYVKPEKAWQEHSAKHIFRRGWVTELVVEHLNVAMARALLQSPGLRFLQTLEITTQSYEQPAGTRGAAGDETYEPGPDIPADLPEHISTPAYHVLARFPHFAAVRRFRLGGKDAEKGEPLMDEDQCHTDGQFVHHLLKQMPHVEEIRLRAHRVETAKVFALPTPNLRVLVVDHCIRYPLEKLAENKTVTKLTHLACWPHATDVMDDEDEDQGLKAYIRLKQLRAVCRADWPQLEFLRLRLTDFGDDGAKELVASGVLKRLKYLDLAGGCITDAGAEKLAGCADIKRLETLILDENAMSSVGVKAIQAVVPHASIDGQHTEVPPFEGNDGYVEYLGMGDME